MAYIAPSTSSLQSTERIDKGEIKDELQLQSPHTVSIHVLDNDSLLNVFYLYQSLFSSEDDDKLSDFARLVDGTGGWARRRWWYKPARVCQRWRNIILGSAFHLGVSLACTNGTPVADMLAHSPPLPLIIDYYDLLDEEDEERAIIALKNRVRLRRIRLRVPYRNLLNFVPAIDDEYPILEYLILYSEDPDSILMFPETLQAPQLRHLVLCGFKLPIGSRLFTSAVGLVTFVFIATPRPDSYFYPTSNSLLHWVSFMPQLETLMITHSPAIFNGDVERQIAHIPIITPVTLRNLRRFTFLGRDTYLEAFIPQIITPRLEKLEIYFAPSQLAFSVPRLQQFISTAKNLKFDSAKFKFIDGGFDVKAYPHGEAEMLPLSLRVRVECWHLDRRNAPSGLAARHSSFNSLGQMFSAVEHLALEHEEHSSSSEELNGVGCTEWRQLLRSFRNVKTLHIDNEIIWGLSRCLDADDGELSLELLPELQELTYFGDGNTGDVFTSFIDARQSVGRPITLVRHSPSSE